MSQGLSRKKNFKKPLQGGHQLLVISSLNCLVVLSLLNPKKQCVRALMLSQ